jgi:hypothetical protein
MVGYKKSLKDTKGVTRSRKSKYNGQKKKDKQWFTKHYIEN